MPSALQRSRRPKTAERYPRCDSRRSRRRFFNGAAVRRRRATLPAAAVRERTCAFARSGRVQRRPPSEDGGEAPAGIGSARVIDVASTEPPSEDGGEAGVLQRTASHPGTSFNGAAVRRRRREHEIWRSTSTRQQLQRSRRPKTAERAPRHSNGAAVSGGESGVGFNGAAVRRRRRAKTHVYHEIVIVPSEDGGEAATRISAA